MPFREFDRDGSGQSKCPNKMRSLDPEFLERSFFETPI
jgi:hypothetical protein